MHRHKWQNWSNPYDSTENVIRGHFGDSKNIDVVRQDRKCLKCNLIQSQIIRQGIIEEGGAK